MGEAGGSTGEKGRGHPSTEIVVAYVTRGGNGSSVVRRKMRWKTLFRTRMTQVNKLEDNIETQ